MSYKDIVFLVETPILNRYYQRYGIAELREQGFKVSIWDLSPMLLPIAYQSVNTDLCDYEACGFFRIFTQIEFEEVAKRKDNAETLFICSMGYQWEYRKVFRFFKKWNYHFIYFMQDLAPADVATVNKSIQQKIVLKNIRKAFTRRIPRKFHGVKNADFILGCGGDETGIANYKAIRLCRGDCPVHFFHSSNYEECLRNAALPRLIEKQYCVFIDQYLPYHPDLIEEGICIEPDAYFKEMNALFDFLEEQYDLEVVIAAHPRSDYNRYPGVFGDRKVIKNSTCRLIKDAQFVIYHFSDSLAYVALYKKPVLLVSNDTINRFSADYIKLICDQLETEEINLSIFLREPDKEKIDQKLIVREDIYEDYVKRYMKKEYSGELEGAALWTQIGRFLMQM